jgi:hypothetical protein
MGQAGLTCTSGYAQLHVERGPTMSQDVQQATKSPRDHGAFDSQSVSGSAPNLPGLCEEWKLTRLLLQKT